MAGSRLLKHLLRRGRIAGALALFGALVAAAPAHAQERWNPNLMICGTSSDGVWPGSGGNCQASLPADGTGLLYPNDFAEVIDPVTQIHHLLVADTENGRVLRFLDDGSAITFAGELAAGSFLEPFGVVGDADGNILVADTHQVYLFDWSGQAIGNPFSQCVGDQTPFSQPYRVTVTPGTKVTPGHTVGEVLIIDTGNNRVVICDGAMTFRANFGSLPGVPGADPGAFSAPTGLAVDQTGHLYVADPNNVRVQVFDWNASHDLASPPSLVLGSQPAWIISNEVPGTHRTSVPEMLYPFGLAIDANGRLLVADAGVNKMWVFDTFANQLKELNVNIGTGSTCDQDCWPPPPPGPPGELLVPANISLDSTGRLMIADAYNMRVQRFTHPPMTVTITPPSATVQLNQPLELNVAVQAASGVFTSVQLAYTVDVLAGNISSLGTPTIQAETTDTVTAGQGPTNFTMTFATTGVATFAFHVWATGIPGIGLPRIDATDGAGITESISVGVSGNYPTTVATVTSSADPELVGVAPNTVLWYTTQPNVHLVATGHPDPPNAIHYKIAIERPVPGATDYSTCGQSALDAGTCDVAITADGLTRVWYRAKSTTADTPPVDLVAPWESIDVHYDAQPPLVIGHTLSPAAINGWNNSSFTITYYLFKGAVGWPTDASGNPLVANSGTIQVVAGPAPTEQADSSGFYLTVPKFTDAAGRSTEENGPVQLGPFKLDTIPPTATCTPSSSYGPNSAGWYRGTVTVTFTATDPGNQASGIDGFATSQTVLTQEGKLLQASINAGFFKDLAGNGNTAQVVCGGINIDQTPPTVTAALTSSSGTVTFTVSDAMSGVVTVHYVVINAAGSVVASGDLTPPALSVVVTNSGKNQVIYYAIDKAGNQSAPASTDVLISNQSPVCSAAAADVQSLWPPNHKFVTIAIKGVTDLDGDRLTIAVNTIWQDESTMADGSGDTPIDGNILGSTAQVRAERAGTGNGRVYEIFFTATDTTGGSCGGSVTVAVPHDQSGAPAFDSGVRYNSLVKNGPRVR